MKNDKITYLTCETKLNIFELVPQIFFDIFLIFRLKVFFSILQDFLKKKDTLNSFYPN